LDRASQHGGGKKRQSWGRGDKKSEREEKNAYPEKETRKRGEEEKWKKMFEHPRWSVRLEETKFLESEKEGMVQTERKVILFLEKKKLGTTRGERSLDAPGNQNQRTSHQGKQERHLKEGMRGEMC